MAGRLVVIRTGDTKHTDKARNILAAREGASMVTAKHLGRHLHTSHWLDDCQSGLLKDAARIGGGFGKLAESEIILAAEAF